MKVPIYNFLLYSKANSINFDDKLHIQNYSDFNFRTVNYDIFPIYKYFNKIDKNKPQNLINFNIGNEFAIELFN